MKKLKKSLKLFYLIALLNFWLSNAKTINEENDFSLNLTTVGKSDNTVNELELKWIKSDDLIELLFYLKGDSNIKKPIIIDTRSSNEFNGWKYINSSVGAKFGLFSLYDEKNGHIIGSNNFDSSWIDKYDPTLLVDHISSEFGDNIQTKAANKINSNDTTTLILYGNDQENIEKVKNFLLDKFSISRIYLSEIKNTEISNYFKLNDTSALFFQEPFYDMLISPEVLNSILRPYEKNGEIEVNPIADYILIDVSDYKMEKYYESSHIPSAVYLNINELEGPFLMLMKSKNKLAKILLDLGIKPNNSEIIILYGNPDQIASFRAAIILKYMGVRDVRVLNGGYQSWLIKNFPTQRKLNDKKSIKDEIELKVKQFEDLSLISQSPINYLVDLNYVNDLVQNMEIFSDQYSIIDVRSKEDYVTSRIPGSIWGCGGSKSNPLEYYRNPDLTMRSGAEILKMWDAFGIDYKNKHLIFYSDNGWVSSEIMFYAELMGLYRVSVYDGGFNEYIYGNNNTIETGIPENMISNDFALVRDIEQTNYNDDNSTLITSIQETTCQTTEAETTSSSIKTTITTVTYFYTKESVTTPDYIKSVNATIQSFTAKNDQTISEPNISKITLQLPAGTNSNSKLNPSYLLIIVFFKFLAI